jgi:hypothetical protein
MTPTPTYTDAAVWEHDVQAPQLIDPAPNEPAPDAVDQVREAFRSRVRLLVKVAAAGTLLLVTAAVAKGMDADGVAVTAFWFGVAVLSYATDLPRAYRVRRTLDNPPVQAELVGPEHGVPWLLAAADGSAPLHFTGSPVGGSDPDGVGTVQSVVVFARQLSPGHRALVMGPEIPRVSFGRLRSGAGTVNRAGTVAEGWFPDPWSQAPVRWWDGHRWTHRTIRSGAASAEEREPADDGAMATSPVGTTSPDAPSPRSGRLEGRQWLTSGILCSALAAVVVGLMIGIAVGNHGGVHPSEVAGELALASIAALLVAMIVRLRRTRYLDWDETGLVVHNLRNDRVIAWTDVTGVDLTVRSGEGGTTFTPTLRLRSGRPCRIHSLCRSQASRAQCSVTTILALRDRFL